MIELSEKKLDPELKAVSLFIENISEKHNLSFEDVLQQLNKKRQSENSLKIPSFIFRERLGILESLVKYLKEEHNLTYHKIAVLLKRDDRVIWASYSNAIKKKKSKFAVKEPNLWVPVTIFNDCSLGLLESLARYLKDIERLSLIQIANLLNRDARTIWSSYNTKNQRKK